MVDEGFGKRINIFGAWSGVLYLSIILVGLFFVAGFFPLHKPSAGADEIASIFASHVLRIWVGFVIAMFGTIMFLSFRATVASHVARYEGRTGTLKGTDTRFAFFHEDLAGQPLASVTGARR
jgi:hypothetical protein